MAVMCGLLRNLLWTNERGRPCICLLEPSEPYLRWKSRKIPIRKARKREVEHVFDDLIECGVRNQLWKYHRSLHSHRAAPLNLSSTSPRNAANLFSRDLSLEWFQTPWHFICEIRDNLGSVNRPERERATGDERFPNRRTWGVTRETVCAIQLLATKELRPHRCVEWSFRRITQSRFTSQYSKLFKFQR